MTAGDRVGREAVVSVGNSLLLWCMPMHLGGSPIPTASGSEVRGSRAGSTELFNSSPRLRSAVLDVAARERAAHDGGTIIGCGDWNVTATFLVNYSTPNSCNRTGVIGPTTIALLVPVTELVTVSVAVIVWLPTVFSVAEKVPVPLVNVESAGNTATPSVLVKCTVPAYAVGLLD